MWIKEKFNVLNEDYPRFFIQLTDTLKYVEGLIGVYYRQKEENEMF